MEQLEELKRMGVDVDDGLSRLNGKESLYAKLLLKFADVLEQSPVQPDFKDEDCEHVAASAHSIKGNAGNLSVTPIYAAYSEVVRLLRAGEAEQARTVLAEIQPTQRAIIDCIKRSL